MEYPYETPNGCEVVDSGLQIIRYSPYQTCSKLSSPWFDLKVFYVRVSNFKVDDSTPEFLTLSHIPVTPDASLEVNGTKSSIYSDGVSSILRRDRADKKSEEATFVSTDHIRLTDGVKFQVYDNKDLILSGVLEMSKSNGFVGESKHSAKRWSLNCESEITTSAGLFKGKQLDGPELSAPTIEVYVAGCYSGNPIILINTLQLNIRKKQTRNGILDAISENETTDCQKDDTPPPPPPPPEDDVQVVEYRNYKPENVDYSDMYWRTECMDGEDGELSWFNAGVRVGVGIGLGICLGVGIGVGLLVRTTRNFKRKLL